MIKGAEKKNWIIINLFHNFNSTIADPGRCTRRGQCYNRVLGRIGSCCDGRECLPIDETGNMFCVRSAIQENQRCGVSVFFKIISVKNIFISFLAYLGLGTSSNRKLYNISVQPTKLSIKNIFPEIQRNLCWGSDLCQWKMFLRRWTGDHCSCWQKEKEITVISLQ